MPSPSAPSTSTSPRTIRVFLASQSPRRKTLLESAGVAPIVIAPDPAIDAEAIEMALPQESALPYVQRVATIKRDMAASRIKQLAIDCAASDLILAADTTVALAGRILGKPASKEEAVDMLRALSGTTHQVHTAVSICTVDQTRSDAVVVSADVRFAPLSDAWIADYVASGEPMDKAGGYGIQGRAGSMIPSISGSYTTIVGLPLFETLKLITQLSCAALNTIR